MFPILNLRQLGLVKRCEGCDGTSIKDHKDFSGKAVKILCPDCNAKGRVPTDLGFELIQFLKYNWNKEPPEDFKSETD